MVLLHPKNFDLHRISCFGNKGSHCESEGTSDYQGNFVEHQYVIYINFVVRGFTAKRHQRFVVGTIDVHYLEHWEILRILSFFTLNYYTCLNLNEVFWPNLYKDMNFFLTAVVYLSLYIYMYTFIYMICILVFFSLCLINFVMWWIFPQFVFYFTYVTGCGILWQSFVVYCFACNIKLITKN